MPRSRLTEKARTAPQTDGQAASSWIKSAPLSDNMPFPSALMFARSTCHPARWCPTNLIQAETDLFDQATVRRWFKDHGDRPAPRCALRRTRGTRAKVTRKPERRRGSVLGDKQPPRFRSARGRRTGRWTTCIPGQICLGLRQEWAQEMGCGWDGGSISLL